MGDRRKHRRAGRRVSATQRIHVKRKQSHPGVRDQKLPRASRPPGRRERERGAGERHAAREHRADRRVISNVRFQAVARRTPRHADAQRIVIPPIEAYTSGSLPSSNPAITRPPRPFHKARASVPATRRLSASRLMPRIRWARSASATARAAATHRRVSVYLTPGGRAIPFTGHQVQSVVSPPIRIIEEPPVSVRARRMKIGLGPGRIRRASAMLDIRARAHGNRPGWDEPRAPRRPRAGAHAWEARRSDHRRS